MRNKYWRERQLERIRNEFDEDPKTLVVSLHYDERMPICAIADVLEISEWSVRKWCREWGIKTQRSGYRKLEPVGKVVCRAIALGYSDLPSAIQSLRANGKRWADIQEILGCAEGTISRNMPESAKGFFYVSSAGMETKRRIIRLLNARMARGEIQRGGFAKVPLYSVHPFWHRDVEQHEK